MSAFLSHAWADKALARRIARRLAHRGLGVWLDEQQMDPGDALPKRLQSAIRSCPYFLVLITSSSEKSRWVLSEIASARDASPDVTIVPLVGEAGVKSPVLDDFIGVDVSGTALVEPALDEICRIALRDPGGTSRDVTSMRQDLSLLAVEVPSLTGLDLSDTSANHRLQTIGGDESIAHQIETFVAIQWDLAVAAHATDEGRDDRGRAHVAWAVAPVFGRHGLGYFVLNEFVRACRDSFDVHNMFSPILDRPLEDARLIPLVQRLISDAVQPQHIVLRWFVLREFERMSAAQRAWAVAHFVATAKDPDNDGIFTAFALFRLMPQNKTLEDLWRRWVFGGQLGFDGYLHLDRVRTFFELINDAVRDGLSQFEPLIPVFRTHARNLSRGRGVRERLAAAQILVLAQSLPYVDLGELAEEVGAAPFRAEWKDVDLPASFTDAFLEVVGTVKRSAPAHDQLTRLRDAARGLLGERTQS